MARPTTGASVARFQRRNHGAGHSYTLDAAKIPGVTTVLNATLAKPALINWAARTAAEYAVDNWAELAGVPVSERLDRIRKAHNQRSRDAMTRGSRIHAFACLAAGGESVDVPEELAEPVDAYVRFLDQWDMRPLHTESPVCNTGHRYGGTLDAIVESDRLGRILLDIKTGGIYRESVLQLAAYRYSNLLIDANGDEIDMPEVAGCFVAHVLGDAVELVPVDADENVWRTFLYALTIYRWNNQSDYDPIGSPLYPESVGA